ncbi:MAG: hypothetical protein Kow00109_04170 [Acidobacteriota bacterium]
METIPCYPEPTSPATGLARRRHRSRPGSDASLPQRTGKPGRNLSRTRLLREAIQIPGYVSNFLDPNSPKAPDGEKSSPAF